MTTEATDDAPDPALVARLRAICGALPEVVEEPAWTGVRWQVRGRTFAHVLRVRDGWPPAYARAAAHDGPIDLVTFRAAGDDLVAMREGGAPFFAPPWRGDEVGLVADEHTDDRELAALVVTSYRLRAPRALAALVPPPG